MGRLGIDFRLSPYKYIFIFIRLWVPSLPIFNMYVLHVHDINIDKSW